MLDQQEAIEETGCAEESDALLLCYDGHGRDWRACRAHIAALRACYERYVRRRQAADQVDPK